MCPGSFSGLLVPTSLRACEMSGLRVRHGSMVLGGGRGGHSETTRHVLRKLRVNSKGDSKIQVRRIEAEFTLLYR